MVIKNSANTVGQPMQGVRGQSPARFSENCSVSGQGVRLLCSANTVQCQVRGCVGEAPARVREHCSVSRLG